MRSEAAMGRTYVGEIRHVNYSRHVLASQAVPAELMEPHRTGHKNPGEDYRHEGDQSARR
jgi:hypothetical protein